MPGPRVATSQPMNPVILRLSEKSSFLTSFGKRLEMKYSSASEKFLFHSLGIISLLFCARREHKALQLNGEVCELLCSNWQQGIWLVTNISLKF